MFVGFVSLSIFLIIEAGASGAIIEPITKKGDVRVEYDNGTFVDIGKGSANDLEDAIAGEEAAGQKVGVVRVDFEDTRTDRIFRVPSPQEVRAQQALALSYQFARFRSALHGVTTFILYPNVGPAQMALLFAINSSLLKYWAPPLKWRQTQERVYGGAVQPLLAFLNGGSRGVPTQVVKVGEGSSKLPLRFRFSFAMAYGAFASGISIVLLEMDHSAFAKMMALTAASVILEEALTEAHLRGTFREKSLVMFISGRSLLMALANPFTLYQNEVAQLGVGLLNGLVGLSVWTHNRWEGISNHLPLAIRRGIESLYQKTRELIGSGMPPNCL